MASHRVDNTLIEHMNDHCCSLCCMYEELGLRGVKNHMNVRTSEPVFFSYKISLYWNKVKKLARLM